MNSHILRLRVLALIAVGAATSALSFPLRADPPTYRIFYLGRLGSGTSEALGLNDQGAVVGQSNFKAFVYVFTPAYGFTPLTITQIATNNFASTANDINNAGYAVGQGKQSSGANPEAYGWRLDSGAVTATPFGIFTGGFSSEAFGINEASTPVLVGTSEGANPTCGRQPLPFKADFDTPPSLDLLGTSAQINARASGIDNSSPPRIVGTSNNDPTSCTFFAICDGEDKNDAKQWLGAGVTTLLDFNPPPSFNLLHEAMDVNDQGQIAGTGWEDSDPGTSFVCRRDSLFWASSTAAPVRLVPDVSTDHAFARAIRNQLASDEIQVVGLNVTAERALLWIRSGSTWTTYKLIDRLLQATAGPAFVMRPTSTNAAGSLGLVCTAAGFGPTCWFPRSHPASPTSTATARWMASTWRFCSATGRSRIVPLALAWATWTGLTARTPTTPWAMWIVTTLPFSWVPGPVRISARRNASRAGADAEAEAAANPRWAMGARTPR